MLNYNTRAPKPVSDLHAGLSKIEFAYAPQQLPINSRAPSGRMFDQPRPVGQAANNLMILRQ